jgi:preprotein translocase subunit SecG
MNVTTILTILLLVLSTALVVAVLLQPSKSSGFSGSIAGGAEQLFGKKRTKPYEAMLHKATIVLSIATFALATVMNFIA